MSTFEEKDGILTVTVEQEPTIDETSVREISIGLGRFFVVHESREDSGEISAHAQVMRREAGGIRLRQATFRFLSKAYGGDLKAVREVMGYPYPWWLEDR